MVFSQNAGMELDIKKWLMRESEKQQKEWNWMKHQEHLTIKKTTDYVDVLESDSV